MLLIENSAVFKSKNTPAINLILPRLASTLAHIRDGMGIGPLPILMMNSNENSWIVSPEIPRGFLQFLIITMAPNSIPVGVSPIIAWASISQEPTSFASAPKN